MQKRFVVGAVLALGLLSSGVARADSKVLLKGGLGIVTSDLNKVTSVGPVWGLIFNVQPIQLIGIELGYEGSRNALSDPSVPASTGLLRNGAFGLAKVGLPLVPIVHPFVGAGVGVGYVVIQGQSSTAYDNGFTLEVPIAAGVEIDLLALSVGARATYHHFLTQQFVKNPNVGVGIFDVEATIGLSF